MEQTKHENIVLANDNELKVLNIFWAGFIIYTSAFTISITEQVNFTVCNLIQIIGLVIMVPTILILIRLRIENKYLQMTFLVYYFWSILVILRGFLLEYDFIKQMLFNAYEGVLIFLLPIILLFPRNLQYIKKVFAVIIILGVIYIFYSLLFIKDLIVSYDIKNSQDIIEYFSKTLSLPCGFILITYIYHSNRKNLLALGVIALTFVFAVFRARRALAFMAFIPIIMAYFFYLFYSKSKIMKFVFFFIIAVMITIAVAYLQSIVYYFSTSELTSWFVDRIGQDSRSEVEQYFFRDLKTIDWIIGKGINGQYFCPGVSEGIGQISIYRSGIETDYLNTILKGGLVSLGLALLILIPAMFKGFFHSKNLLSKAAASWILLYLACLYPAPVSHFTLNYILVWISVGICYSRELRNMSDTDIKEALSEKKIFPETIDYQ